MVIKNDAKTSRFFFAFIFYNILNTNYNINYLKCSRIKVVFEKKKFQRPNSISTRVQIRHENNKKKKRKKNYLQF